MINGHIGAEHRSKLIVTSPYELKTPDKQANLDYLISSSLAKSLGISGDGHIIRFFARNMPVLHIVKYTTKYETLQCEKATVLEGPQSYAPFNTCFRFIARSRGSSKLLYILKNLYAL